MTIYREILAKRRDMTEWLIHFTRGVDGRSGKESFLSILIGGVLRPTFAHRGSPPRPTIYGMHPAVCFTEQPISAFLDYLEVRTKQNEMTGYGIFLHKNDLFAIGGLPVIYGLPAATELVKGDNGYVADRRLLRDDHLNMIHQYRYNAFAPTREDDPLDWSHEREWRWPARHMRKDGEPLGLLLGQPSFSGRGDFECRVHAFVDKDEDIPWVQEQLRAALNNGTLGQGDDAPGKRYGATWRAALQDVRVISLETARRQLRAGAREYERFETWPGEKAPALPA
jgi:hypothetical protein